MTRKWPLIGLALAVLWLFVRGIEWMGNPINVVEELLIGLGVGMPVAYVARRLYADEFALSRNLQVVPSAVLYLLLFLSELVTANVDVAYRVLSPSMPIEPTVVEVPLRVESDAAITTIANSISLTPVTLTMDYDPNRNALYVHALSGRGRREEILEPIRRWENYALVIFDEPLGPGAPVPDPDRRERDDVARPPRRDGGRDVVEENGGDGDGN